MGLFKNLFYSQPVEKINPKLCTDPTFHKLLVKAAKWDHDLVWMTKHSLCCGECAKYQGRVFSLTGKDKRFPKIPEQVLRTGKIHPGCRHTFTLYFWGLDSKKDKEMLRFSNRPFIDDRSEEIKRKYNFNSSAQTVKNSDRENYNRLCRCLPDLAPKSFNGYCRMKNSNSKNFQKLKVEAKKHDINL